jgi:hypothetical protein
LMSLWSFQGACATGAPHQKEPALRTGLSKLSSDCSHRGRRCSRRV